MVKIGKRNYFFNDGKKEYKNSVIQHARISTPRSRTYTGYITEILLLSKTQMTLKVYFLCD